MPQTFKWYGGRVLTCYEKLFSSFNCAMLQMVLRCFDSCYDCCSSIVMTFHLACTFKSFQLSPNAIWYVLALMCATKLMSVIIAITNPIILLPCFFFRHSVYGSIILVCHIVLCKFHTAFDVLCTVRGGASLFTCAFFSIQLNI